MHRILIAEDEPDIRDLIALTLRFGGFEVITAINGVEAVEKAKSEVPDLILLDVRMPRMTGYEACAAIKADETTAPDVLIKRVKELLENPTKGKPAADASPKPIPQPNSEKQSSEAAKPAGE